MLHAIEGCTLTANVDHGVKFAPMEMVKEDLKERNIRLDRRTMDEAARTKLEHILREEDECQGLSLYCRDKRFTDVASDTLLEHTILDMLHCPMRMHEKVLNVCIVPRGFKWENVGPGRQCTRHREVAPISHG
jgi:hypothetical protein